MKLLSSIVIFTLLFCSSLGLNAETKLPAILSDNMCLQQSAEVKIWGWDIPGQKVIVNPSWGKKYQTLTNGNGEWYINITTPKAGEIGKIDVTGSTQQSINNIAFGEVWVCSGQSNMERQLGLRNGQKPIVNFWEEVQNANYPKIRMFKVSPTVSKVPLNNCQGRWVECNPETVFEFSAVGYFYGQALYKSLSVPVGLIQASRGGTPIKAWTPDEGIGDKTRAYFITLESTFEQDSEYYKTALSNYKKRLVTEAPTMPESVRLLSNKYKNVSALYNGMIAPLTNYTIKGVIWYQGEADVADWKAYKTMFPRLITSWRNNWGIGAFPFYFVQIPPYNYEAKYDMPFGMPKIVEAQSEALKLSNTGVASTQDLGTYYDIHPPHKKEVGRRLSLIALNKTYNKTDVVYAVPVLKSYNSDGNQMILQMETPDSELYLLAAAIDKITAFYIAGDDKIFYKARVKQEGNTIQLSSPQVEHPVAVRYNWENSANATIYNKQGLPALPFRTDTWENVFYVK